MIFRKSEQRLADELTDEIAEGVGPNAMIHGDLSVRHTRIIAAVIAGLRREGVRAKSPAEFVKLFMLIVDLIQTIGPKIREIIDAIRKSRE
jgi:hypothetical protein